MPKKFTGRHLILRSPAMPILPENRKRYLGGSPTSKEWRELSERVRFERAGNKCEECGAQNYEPHPVTGSKVVLTVAHLDHCPENNDLSNLMAMCQRCHNRYDAEHRALTRMRRKELENQQKLWFGDWNSALPDDVETRRLK